MTISNQSYIAELEKKNKDLKLENVRLKSKVQCRDDVISDLQRDFQDIRKFLKSAIEIMDNVLGVDEE